MHGHVLTEYVVVANPQARRFTCILQILGRIPDYATGMKPVARSNDRPPSEMRVWSHDALGAHGHLCVNHRIRPDLCRGIDGRLGIDDGGRMNHGRDLSVPLSGTPQGIVVLISSILQCRRLEALIV